VVQVGRTSLAPVHDVVRGAPPRWTVAAGPAANSVARVQSSPHGSGHRPLRAADVDHLRVAAEEDAGHLQSQASRRIAAPEIGSENSTSAAGAPARWSKVSSEV